MKIERVPIPADDRIKIHKGKRKEGTGMKKNVKKLLGTVCAAVLMLNLAGCGGSSTENAENNVSESVVSETAADEVAAVEESSVDGGSGREITIASTNLGDFSPFGGYGGASSSRDHILFCLYDRIAYAPVFGSTLDELELQMAKSITYPDKYTAEIELYDYIHDNQGNPITADDVVWSYEFGKTQGDNERVDGYLESITATGDYSVELKINSEAPGAMEYMLCQIPIVSQEWYENATDDEKVYSPAGTGTYKISDMLTGSYVVLTAVEDYWQTDDSLKSSISHQLYDTITYKSIPEDTARTIAMQNHEADVNTKVSASDIVYYMNDDGSSKEGWNVSAEYRGSFICMMFNCDESNMFSDIALRKAVLYGMDSEAFRLGTGGTATSGVALKTFGPTVAGDYNTAWDSEDYYEYDLEKAQEYLAEAGYAPGELKVRLLTVNDSDRVAGCAVFQAQMADLGIDVEILSYDQALFNTYKYDCTQWDIILDNRATSDFLVSVWTDVFNEKGYENGGANFVHDDYFQELLNTACDVHDEDSVNAFHEYLKEQAYAIGLYQNVSYMVAQDKITVFDLDGSNNMAMLSFGLADDYESVVK